MTLTDRAITDREPVAAAHSDPSTSRLGWSVARLLREVYPNIRLRQAVRDHPLLENVTIGSLVEDALSLNAFLGQFALLPQCGSTQVSRLREVLVSELQEFRAAVRAAPPVPSTDAPNGTGQATRPVRPPRTLLVEDTPVRIPVATFSAVPDTTGTLRVATASQPLADMLGMPVPQEADLSGFLAAFMSPEDRKAFQDAIRGAAREPTAVSWSGSMRTAAGWRHVSIAVQPPRPADPKQIWTGVLQDLTEVTGLRESLETVLNAAQAFTWRRDLRLKQSQFGPSWARFARHDDGINSMTNDEWLARVHPEDAPRISRQIELLERGERRHQTMLYRRKLADESWAWLRVNAGVSEEDENGVPLALSGVSFDVTAEMQERAHHAQERRDLRNERDLAQTALERTVFELTENIPVGTYTMRLEPGAQVATFGFMSQRFFEITGLSEEIAREDPFKAFACVHPEDYADWVQKNIEAFTCKMPFRGETRLLVDGQVRWIVAESVPRLKEDGTWIWEGVIQDLTRQKQTEHALRAVNKELLEKLRESYPQQDRE